MLDHGPINNSPDFYDDLFLTELGLTPKVSYIFFFDYFF